MARANLKVAIIEKIKQKDGTWTNVGVEIPKAKPNGKGFYLKDRREGKFYLLWREGQKRRYHSVEGMLTNAIAAKVQKERYLASVAAGLKVEDPVGKGARLTVAQATDEFLSTLTGRGNTVPLYTQNLRQFQEWNSSTARKKTYLDQIDRQHLLGFKKHCQDGGNEELTAIWKIIRVNKMVKTLLNLPHGKGPINTTEFSAVLKRKPVVVTYTKDERDKFLVHCTGIQFLIWSLFLKCGLRLKELTHLEWNDVDFDAHVLHIRKKKVMDGETVVDFLPKKNSIRDVAIPDDLYTLLQKHRGTAKGNLVFPTRSGRINTKMWSKCKSIAGKAGLDVSKFKPKTFRSSYATNRLRNGYTLTDVRDQLGHKDMHSIEHYVQALRTEDLVKQGLATKGWD